jgi:hypothetical protein
MSPGNPAATGSVSSQTVAITVPPVSQTVPLGVAATFTVKATGAGQLSYQWLRNGAEIDGATSTTYTTAALTATDNGAAYTVVVKDLNGAVTSSAATLTAGPRAPAAGDLRLLLFQQATASGLGSNSQSGSLATNSAVLYPGAVGSPLELGSSSVCQSGVEYGCDWNFFVESLPTSQNGLTMLYQGRLYDKFQADLSCIEAPNVVVHSLDLEPANNAYGMAWVSSLTGSGFDLRIETVDPADIATAAAADGTESRVITAVSFDETGKAVLLSYGWTGDTHTVFEAKTVQTTLASIVAEAKKLAAAGYIVSAFGGNDANGYLLVGTRVQGDTIARTLAITTPTSTYTTSTATQSAYSTPVVRFVAADGTQTLISEY